MMEAKSVGIFLFQQRTCDTRDLVSHVPVQLLAYLFSQVFILENKNHGGGKAWSKETTWKKHVGEIHMANRIHQGLTHHLRENAE